MKRFVLGVRLWVLVRLLRWYMRTFGLRDTYRLVDYECYGMERDAIPYADLLAALRSPDSIMAQRMRVYAETLSK